MSHFLLQREYANSPESNAILMASTLDDHVCHRASLSEISLGDRIPREAVPVGSVEFARARMRQIGISEPLIGSYPDALRSFLMRSLERTTLGDAAPGSFVKPVRVKAFDAITDYPGFETCGLNLPAETPCWSSPKQTWLSEYRAYILDGDLAGIAQYGEGDDWDLGEPLLAQLHAMIRAWTGAPAAYALDVAVVVNEQLETLWDKGCNYGTILNGSLALVEVNDGWATGYYRDAFSPREYAAWLNARWMELIRQNSGQSADYPSNDMPKINGAA